MAITSILRKNGSKLVSAAACPPVATTIQQFLIAALSKSTYIDTIDSFTNNLVDRKTLKWEVNRDKIEKTSMLPPISKQFSIAAKQIVRQIASLNSAKLGIDFANLSQDHIDQLVRSAIFEDNQSYVHEMIDECRHHSKLPSDRVVQELCLYLVKHLDLNTLKMLIKIDEVLAKKYGCYVGLCLWKLGNYQAGLELLRSKFNEATDSQAATIRSVFELIVSETVEQKSEAILVALTRTAVCLFEKHGDLFVLSQLWRCSFQSNWYSDQQLADQLFDQYEEVRQAVADKYVYIYIVF